MQCYVFDSGRKHLVQSVFKFQFMAHAVTDMMHRTDIQVWYNGLCMVQVQIGR